MLPRNEHIPPTTMKMKVYHDSWNCWLHLIMILICLFADQPVDTCIFAAVFAFKYNMLILFDYDHGLFLVFACMSTLSIFLPSHLCLSIYASIYLPTKFYLSPYWLIPICHSSASILFCPIYILCACSVPSVSKSIDIALYFLFMTCTIKIPSPYCDILCIST
jgi:hypothetical protein